MLLRDEFAQIRVEVKGLKQGDGCEIVGLGSLTGICKQDNWVEMAEAETLYRENGIRHPLKDVTNVILTSKYYWSPESWQQPRSWTTITHNAGTASMITQKAANLPTSDSLISPPTKVCKRVHWNDPIESSFAASAPPQTPQLGQLRTPKLELQRDINNFYNFCYGKHIYYEDRLKMNSKCMFKYLLSF